MRPNILSDPTYRAIYPAEDGKEHDVFVTVNEEDGKPIEVFVRLDDPKLYEWVTVLTLMITRALRAGEKLKDVAQELRQIHSPATRHFIPGGKGVCPSLVARIGEILLNHEGKI